MEIALRNAIGATVLALLVAGIGARLRRPAAMHALWLLVLVKLVTPPVLEVGSFPGPGILAALPARPAGGGEGVVPVAGREGGTAAGMTSPEVFLPITGPTGTPGGGFSVRPAHLAARLGAAGSLAILLLAGLRILRFRRLLRRAGPAPPDLHRRALGIARALGVSRVPRLRLVSARISPVLWPGPGACEILLPAALMDRLRPEETDALLAHELAHLRRRDHWVRPFELLVTALYWWHPVVWWVRRNLHRAEERSCDEFVVRSLPGGPRVYARSLLKTVEFLSVADAVLPDLATGAGGGNRLEERLTIILDERRRRPMTTLARAGLATAALIALLVTPTWTHRGVVRAGTPVAAAAGAADTGERRFLREMLDFHRERLVLEKGLRELEGRRRDIERKIEEAELHRHLGELAHEIERLDRAGKEQEAERLRHEADQVRKRAALRRERADFQREHDRQRAQLEFRLQEIQLRHEELRIEGKESEAAEALERAQELERRLRTLQVEAMRRELEYGRAELEQELEELEALPVD